MITASYQHGVDWIAVHTRPTVTNRAAMAVEPCVRLLAEMFDMTPEDVACDVVAARRDMALIDSRA